MGCHLSAATPGWAAPSGCPEGKAGLESCWGLAGKGVHFSNWQVQRGVFPQGQVTHPISTEQQDVPEAGFVTGVRVQVLLVLFIFNSLHFLCGSSLK